MIDNEIFYAILTIFSHTTAKYRKDFLPAEEYIGVVSELFVVLRLEVEVESAIGDVIVLLFFIVVVVVVSIAYDDVTSVPLEVGIVMVILSEELVILSDVIHAGVDVVTVLSNTEVD